MKPDLNAVLSCSKLNYYLDDGLLIFTFHESKVTKKKIFKMVKDYKISSDIIIILFEAVI